MSTSPTSPTKLKSKPSHYSPGLFHTTRTISAISSLIVSGILIFFCAELKNGGYKIPWTFLIVLAASLLTLICLLLTALIQCCGRLSPLFNMTLNIPLLILWICGMGLLGWGLYGTLSHSCTKLNWGNDDGIMICQQYKALFSFTVFGAVSQIVMIGIDIKARVNQTRKGTYEKMNDVKLEPYDSTHSLNSSVHDIPYSGQTASTQNLQQTQYHDEPGWRPGQNTNMHNNQSNMSVARSGTMASSRYSDYGDIAGQDGQAQFRMGHFDNQHAPSHQTSYDHGYGNYGNPYSQGDVYSSGRFRN